MDLSQYLQNGADAPAEAGQQLSKEEYAALKKQEREEVWAEVDTKAQEVFQDRVFKFYGPVQAPEGGQPPAPVRPEPGDPAGEDL